MGIIYKVGFIMEDWGMGYEEGDYCYHKGADF